MSADAASKKCSRALSGLLLNDGSTADISEAGGCDNDNAFEFANKNATRSTCPSQLPWRKGCRTMRYSTPSRKGAVDDRGSRRRHETVAHFGHPRIGRPRLCISTGLGCDIIPCQSHLSISCIMRPVYDVVFEAHDFPLTLIGNKKSAKQLLPDFDKVDSF